jgi:large subunit ribosomal protein L10
MNRLEKQNLVSQLRKTFKENSSILLVKFSGVNVFDETHLRREISRVDSCYRVVKNRLALLAAKDTSMEELQEHFEGPTAIVYTNGDPVVLAKVIKKFIEDHPGIALKAGLVEGKYISSEEISDLSSIPSRVELLSKLLFLLSSPLTNLASALQSPVRGLLSLLGQLEGKSGEAAKAAEKTPAEEEAPVETADAVEEGESLNQEV